MKFTIVTLMFLCKGLFTFDGEQCKKYVATDGKQFKIVYILDSERWDVTDTVNIRSDVWNADKDTVIALTHQDSININK